MAKRIKKKNFQKFKCEVLNIYKVIKCDEEKSCLNITIAEYEAKFKTKSKIT